MEKQIICPNCGAKISFLEGTVVEQCVSCHTRFANPNHVPVMATVVKATPVSVAETPKGGK